MGEMRRAISREEEERRRQDRFASTLVIAASAIAAVRTAREDITRPSPRLSAVIFDSVNLARRILDRVFQRWISDSIRPHAGSDHRSRFAAFQ
jgi:hypothetical protein